MMLKDGGGKEGRERGRKREDKKGGKEWKRGREKEGERVKDFVKEEEEGRIRSREE